MPKVPWVLIVLVIPYGVGFLLFFLLRKAASEALHPLHTWHRNGTGFLLFLRWTSEEGGRPTRMENFMKISFVRLIPARYLAIFACIIFWLLVLSITLGCCQICFAQTDTPPNAATPPGRLIDLGGYRLHLNCTGQGSPVVVLSAGSGDFSFDWGLSTA